MYDFVRTAAQLHGHNAALANQIRGFIDGSMPQVEFDAYGYGPCLIRRVEAMEAMYVVFQATAYYFIHTELTERLQKALWDAHPGPSTDVTIGDVLSDAEAHV
jgi:hypothetical protein